MLTGIKPFAASDISGILYNVVNLEPAPVDKLNPAVPRAVSKVVAKLLAKQPLVRYASAADALKEIERARPAAAPAAGMSTLATPGHTDPTTPLREAEGSEPVTDVPLIRRRVPATVFWVVTLLLLAAAATGVGWLRSRVMAVKPMAVMTRDQQELFAAKQRELS